MKEVRVLSATGVLGSGFKEESLKRGVFEMKADVIGSDAGSTDIGPYYLGSGTWAASRQSVKRDLRLMIKFGLEGKIPVLVGSAFTAGGAPHVAEMVKVVTEIAQEENLHFKLGIVNCEIKNDIVKNYYRKGKIKELYPAPKISEDVIDRAIRTVGVMGPEPFIEALNQGAQVVIAGRCTDTAIFAAVPIMNGLDNGSAWHAGKLLECGAACAEQRIYPDCMFAWVREDSFSVEPPNPLMRCTPVSAVSHALYENADPFVLVEPGRVLYIEDASYESESDRRVLVKNSTVKKADQYTIRIEGAVLTGYRSMAIGEIRDPLILKQLDSFIQSAKETLNQKVKAALNLDPSQFKFEVRVFGDPTVKSSAGIGIMMESLAETEDLSESIMAIAWHLLLHHPIPEWSGLQSQIAYPFSPVGINVGEVYQFCYNHVIEVDNPLELFDISYKQL